MQNSNQSISSILVIITTQSLKQTKTNAQKEKEKRNKKRIEKMKLLKNGEKTFVGALRARGRATDQQGRGWVCGGGRGGAAEAGGGSRCHDPAGQAAAGTGVGLLRF